MRKLFQTLFLGLMVVLLGSCSQEENAELNKMKGDLVVLKVGIDGIADKKPSSLSTRSTITDTLIGVSELGNGLVLETRLMPAEPEVQTRFGGGDNMNPGSKILALVYRPDGTPYKYQYLSTSNAEIFLPQGDSFKIVFYSYNTEDKPVIQLTSGSSVPDGNGGFLLTGANFANNIEGNSKNVLFARIENTGVISQMTKLPNIVFTPLFSRMQWELYTEGSVGFTVSGAKINGTYAQASVNMGNLSSVQNLRNMWSGVGTANTEVPLPFNTTQGKRLISEKKIFIVDESKPTTISASVMLNASKEINYSIGKLERGVSYKVVSKLVSQTQKYSVSFASSGLGNVTPDGVVEGTVGNVVTSKATADTESTFLGWFDGNMQVVESTGDVFVTGTTLSVKLTESTNRKAYVARFQGAIVVLPGKAAPRIYVSGIGDDAVLQLTEEARNRGAFFQFGSIRAWDAHGPSVVWNASDNNSKWDRNWNVGENFPAHNNENLRAGKGDPCRLVGFSQRYVKEQLSLGRTVDNGKWRLPTARENEIFGETYSKKVGLDGAAGMYLGPGATENGNGGQFMPCSGFIDGWSGTWGNYDIQGWYNSSTTTSKLEGSWLSLFWNPSIASESQNNGGTVRCVRQ